MIWLYVAVTALLLLWTAVLSARHWSYHIWHLRLSQRERDVSRRERSLDDDMELAFRTGRDVGR